MNERLLPAFLFVRGVGIIMHQDSNRPLAKCQTSIGVIGVLPARPDLSLSLGVDPQGSPGPTSFP